MMQSEVRLGPGEHVMTADAVRERRSGLAVKRSDLTTGEVLVAVREHGFSAFEQLAGIYPVKVVRAAIDRDVRTGLLEYGVSADRPWLSPAGTRRLEAGGPDGGERTGAEGSGAPAAS